MNPELEETFYADFITSSPTTGAAVDADSTPTCEVFEDATDTSILAPTVTKRSGKTGNYRVPLACTTANGFEAGKSYNVVVSATVSSVAAKAVLLTFQIRTNGPDDLAASILTRATPAQVQTELGTYGALKPTTAGRTLDVTTTGEAGVDLDNTVGTLAKGTDITGFNDIAAGAAMTLTAAYDSAKTAAPVGAAMTLTAPYDPAKTAMQAGTAVALTAAYDAAKTAAQAGNAMTLTAAYDAAKTAATQASVDTIDDFLDTEIAAIKAKTDQLVFTGGKVDANATLSLVAADLNAIADAILKRDWTLLSGEAVYSLLNAARMLRNVWTTTGGTLTVRKEDGTTSAWSRTLATDPTAQPIVGAS